MDYLVSQQVLPPPSPPSSLSPHQWENRGEFSVGENKHKGRFSERDRPAFPLFLSLVCLSWEKKKKKKKNCGWSRTGQIPRNSTSDITCSHPLLMEGEDLERDGAGEIKGGFRKLTGGQGGGYTEALCDSAALAPHHADGYNMHRQSWTEPGICVDALHKDL